MSEPFHNPYNPIKNHYIRYLYNEGIRQGVNKQPNFYSEIIKFVNSPAGKSSLETFSKIDPERLGIYAPHIKATLTRMFS